MTTFEQASTKVAAMPMPTPSFTVEVTASVGHMPRTRRKMGFSLTTPLVNSEKRLMVIPYMIELRRAKLQYAALTRIMQQTRAHRKP